MSCVKDKPDDKIRKFERIKLCNWKNFQKVDVHLTKRVFLVGPNASGKSNFLDVLRFLHDIASIGGGFQHAVKKRGGVSSLRCLAARKAPDIVIHVVVSDERKKINSEYELHFSQDNLSRPVVKKERVVINGVEELSRPDEEDTKDQERLTQTYLEQVNVNQKFRNINDFFASIKYLHIVPQLVREPDRSVGRNNDPFGGDFLEQVAQAKEKTQRSRLRKIKDALKVAVPQLAEIELSRDKKGSPHLRGKYEHWRPQGAWQTEEQFSDGTLRLMGLLWALMDGAGPLLLEEPELSLHSEVVRFLPQIFARIQRKSGRQILVSSHSVDLLRDEGVGLDETLLLLPQTEGTSIKSADSIAEIKRLLDSGVSLPDAVIPHTRPQKAEQLTLFDNL